MSLIFALQLNGNINLMCEYKNFDEQMKQCQQLASHPQKMQQPAVR